ncbi:MAG TPA: putative aminohydrolase SsnA [bacterium]|nr:putative aminohydrolase SsnA [bacterium]HOL48794.1 putative aminohydrolase SsnA [bacterium]HPQ19595.1 putative aminohydrolase SsnA [bacterium]
MSSLLIKNGTIITLGENNRMIEDGAIYIEDGIIKEIGSSKELKKKYKDVDEKIDGENKVIMPGYINAHHHLYSTFARGMSLKDEAPVNFVQILERLWWRLDKALKEEDIYYSAMIPLIDCIKKGATTIIDHHASPYNITGSLNKIKEAVKLAGIRACLCYEVSDRDGAERAEEGLRENYNFIKQCQRENDPFISALFGLHASFTVSDETMNKAVAMAKELNVGFHIHTAEDKADVEECLKKHNMRVVERFQKLNILGAKTITAHCIHINEGEMDLLKESGTNVVHNPQSNMNNAVGTADVLKMLSKGIPVGLGSDGMTSDMCKEMNAACLIHKITKQDPRVAFVEPPTMLLFNNAKIANKFFPVKLGEISVGAAADIILIDYIPPTPMTINNFFGHFIFGIASSPVDTTIVGGNILMKKKKLTIIDEEEICARSRELAARLWERF